MQGQRILHTDILKQTKLQNSLVSDDDNSIEADKQNKRYAYMMDLKLYREEFAFDLYKISRQNLKPTTKSANTNTFDFIAYLFDLENQMSIYRNVFSFFYLCLLFLLSRTC